MGLSATVENEAVERELLDQIDRARAPRHIAIIMDGNGRWARRHGFAERNRGHEAAVEAVRASVRGCGEAGVSALSLYSFSTENWTRPRREVNFLMRLLERFLRSEVGELNDNNVHLVASGDIEELPDGPRRALSEAKAALAGNTGLTLNLLLNYGGRREIMRACQRLARDAREGRIDPDAIAESDVSERLYQPELGDVDLLIRTSGELRVSNCMLWEVSYAEILVIPTLWPDFRKPHLFRAILDYQSRDRRFGSVR